MDARSRERLAVAHTILRALRHRDFRNELDGTRASGEHVVAPALPDDTMGVFFDQLRQSAGTIYIGVPENAGIAVLSLAQTQRPKHAAPSRDDCPIHRDTQLKMVIDYLRMSKGPLRCHEATPSITLELVDERPPVCVLCRPLSRAHRPECPC